MRAGVTVTVGTSRVRTANSFGARYAKASVQARGCVQRGEPEFPVEDGVHGAHAAAPEEIEPANARITDELRVPSPAIPSPASSGRLGAGNRSIETRRRPAPGERRHSPARPGSRTFVEGARLRAEEGFVNKDLLVLGANAPEMELLRNRLGRMGYRAVPAKTPDQTRALLRVAGARVGAVIVPSDLPVMNLRSALLSLRTMVSSDELVFLAGGRDPGPEGRRHLRDAGVTLAVFDPCDAHTLRFQVNRALSGNERSRGQRRTVRAPTDLPVVIRTGAGRVKEGRVYSLSASGAFITVQQPCMTRAKVRLDMTVPGGARVAATGHVVMTNVPGNVMRRSLPFGMGVQFDQLSEAVSVSFLVYAQERFRALSL